MKVLAIVPSIYDTSPGQRFRLEQWEPFLKEYGVEITYAPFETEELKNTLYSGGQTLKKVKTVLKNFRKRMSEVKKASEYDLVYVFREAAILGPAWAERKIAGSGAPMIFDFDDAVFESYVSPTNGYLSYLKFPGKTATTVRLSAHIMAGNPYLEKYSRQYNNNVTVIPTTIDTEKYRVVEKQDNGETITIGWSGSHSTVQHLETLRETLAELAKEIDFKLRVIGTDDYTIPGVKVEAMKWRSETEVSDLEKIDIGIMPLPDDRWSKGKCGLKALQYMALGIPTVCSPVEVNSVIIQDGKNGFLADSKEEWISKLKKLVSSYELRKSIGQKGRETVEQSYSAISQAPRVYQLFNSTVKNNKK